MSSDANREKPLGLRIAAIGGLLFLHLPLALIVLYAFTTEEKSFQFPPPGYTTKWFGCRLVAASRYLAAALSLARGRCDRHLLSR